jgi:hypothetical protein
MDFAIKVAITDRTARRYDFPAQKTMYGGKTIAAGDRIYIFASENEGGPGLIAKGRVTRAEAVARTPGVPRQTPRVSLTIDCEASVQRPLGRRELKGFTRFDDGRPESELNFKFYRQATNKVIGLSDAAARFLDGFF